ncbi:MAG: dimethylarginine dimethylaminohydrolase family protein [Geminicoccaceae bacterium]
MTVTCRSYKFRHAIVREPGNSVVSGLRASRSDDPDPELFKNEHRIYVQSLEANGLDVTLLPPLEDFPDAVFVEDAAICTGKTAVLLRPGAPSRRDEVVAIKPALVDVFEQLIDLPGDGLVDGGDVLLTENDAFIGLSERTNQTGFEALSSVLSTLGYRSRKVETPSDILHFKTDCGLLDAETIFATRRLARTRCFDGYQVMLAPDGEEAAANLIRVNDVVLISAGYPMTKSVLTKAGYEVQAIPTSQAALIDGGPSCMSLRF